MSQRDINPTKNKETTQGQQFVFNVARKFGNQTGGENYSGNNRKMIIIK